MVLKFLTQRRRWEPYSALRKTKLAIRERSSNHESPILTIRADGHLVRATALGYGPKHAPTLVFLHEGLGSIAQWRGFPDTLANATNCNAIVYERWGHGGSDALDVPRPADFLEREAERALPDVLDAFGIEQPILVGHSDGGSIALLYAAAFPDRTLGVITEAAHVVVEAESLAGVRAAVDAFTHSDFAVRLANYHDDNTDSMFHGWADTWLSDAFSDWSMTGRLSGIVSPVLAIQGEDDEYGTHRQLSLIKSHVSGRCQALLLPNCGHTPHMQARDRVMEAMTRFIGSLTSE